MRRILLLSSTLALAACATREPPKPQPQAPPPVQTKKLNIDLLGASAGELIQAFGQPALQVREGPGLKLQWRGRNCVLDAYLYPAGAQGDRVTYVDTRLANGNATDRDQCVASLSKL